MKAINRLLVAATAAFTLTTTASAGIGDVPSGEYQLEKTHAYLTFSYLHLGFSRPVVGFSDFDVSLNLNQDDVTASKLMVSINPASIDSGVEKFDDHLKSDDFFDIAAHSDISFTATGIEMTGENTMTITGDLTMKGITKPITLDATVNKAANHPMRKTPTIGISASGKLMRSDWDLGRYAPNVGDEVTLNIQVELIKS
ncbi:MAG: YceI family protein [Pseudomonadota bacterium]